MYAIERFGNITLSPFNNNFTLSPVAVKPSYLTTVGGVFDNDGDGRSQQSFPFQISYSAVVMEDVYADNRDVLDALRSAVGLRAKLYRKSRDDDSLHWCIARLVAMPHDWPYKQRLHFVISLDFQQLTPWFGSDHATWRLDDGYLFDDSLLLDPAAYAVLLSSATSQTVNNGGTLPTSDVTLILTTAANPLSNITFLSPGISTELLGVLPTYIPGSNIRWVGTVPAYSELQIDCGAKAVTLNGVNAYDGFQLVTGHISEEWMTLAPGDNTVTISAIGTNTGATWSINFRDTWA